ncbi:MAG: hypothetical protein K9I85_01225 [Saprospiraceae bacterium]|nr:hypothetical protein [Saprospiraceae bacterium]
MENVNKWLIIGFGAIWTILVLFSYWGFHPYYGLVIQDLPNVSILVVLVGLACGAWWILRSRKTPVRGWMIYAFVLFLEMVIFLMYASREKVFSDSAATHIPYFLGFNLFIHSAVAYLFLVQIAIGDSLMRLLPSGIRKENTMVINLAVGLSVTGFVLVILGMLGGLNTWVLWGLTLLPVALRYRMVMDVLKQFFWAPIKKGVTSGWGIIPIMMLLIAVAFNQVTALKAFPIGFDAVSLYMNRSHLIAQYGGLIAGGQADGWPLWTSLGELMFQSVSVSIMLSHSAMLLCVFAFYRLARTVLNKQSSWLAVALFYVNPAFSFHAAHDAKVDLGFLFILLTAILLLLDMRQPAGAPEDASGSNQKGASPQWLPWILAGWLSGYAFGIKYTAVMFMIGLMAMLFRWQWGWRGAAGLFFTALGGLFLVGIDQFGYMELGDTPPTIFAMIGFGLGLPLLVWAAIRSPKGLAPIGMAIGGFALAALLSFSPWMVKNVSEHQTVSVNNLLVGRNPTALLDANLDDKGEESMVEFQKRVLYSSLENMGVQLNAQQRQISDQILTQTITGKTDSSSVEAQSQLARDQIIQNVLTPEQRQISESSINQFGLDYDAMEEDISMGCELIIESLKRRGISLDSEQKNKVVSLLRGNDVMVEDQMERRKRLATLRQDIFNTVLTSEQYEAATGKKQGALAQALGKHPVKASFFGGTKREEIRRYLGFEAGAPLYFSVPYDMTMNMNIPFSRYLDISFLFLLLLPFLFFGRTWYRNVIVALGFLGLWLISVLSLYPLDTRLDPALLHDSILRQMGEPLSGLAALPGMIFIPLQTMLVSLGNSLNALYQWMADWSFLQTYIIILVLFGLAAWLMREKIARLPEAFGNFFVITLAFGGLWFFFSNTIIWYGFILFMMGFLLIIWLTDHLHEWYPELPKALLTKWWRIAVGTSMVLCLSLFLVSATQNQDGARLIFQSPFLQYASSNMTAEKSLGLFRPYMAEAIQKMNEDPSTKIYRIGTHLNYHILQNDKRVLEDNQLGIYMELSKKMTDKNDFIRKLIDNGFKYVLYNVNLAGTDLTPEQTLAKKADEVLMLLFDSPLATPIYTDNFIEDPAVPTTKVGDKVWPGKPGLGGKTTVPGTFILFELATKMEN